MNSETLKAIYRTAGRDKALAYRVSRNGAERRAAEKLRTEKADRQEALFNEPAVEEPSFVLATACQEGVAGLRNDGLIVFTSPVTPALQTYETL